MSKILIVDDEQQIRRILSVMLAEHGFVVAEADSGEKAIAVSKEFQPDVALLDVNMQGMDGLATLRALIEQHRNLDCVMMTAYGTIRSAVEAMRSGASDYVTKPFDNDELLLIINRALKLRHLSSEVDELRAELSTRYGFNEIVGISPKLQDVFRTMTKVAPIDATVLIEGESGTGKELVARAIHNRSLRATGPFVAVNCGAVPSSLFESEFFGHEKGAFTDARENRTGRFEQAQKGTIFLDEIGELAAENQVKLLRVLQEHELTKLGGRHPIKLNVRVVAATNVNLKAAVESGRFREDLYWRLNVVRVTLPSLRERKEDVALLTDHLMERYNRELGLSVGTITNDARRLLELYAWPGNIRELENVICSAMILCETDSITVRDLPPRIRGEAESSTSGHRNLQTSSLADAVKEASEKLERIMIVSRLAEMKGNRTATSESLGISRKTLFNKMRQFGLSDDAEDSAY